MDAPAHSAPADALHSESSQAPQDASLEAARRIAADIRMHVLDPLKIDFVGKDEVVDLLGVCLVAGENLFLLGPPGTAKSALVKGMATRLEGRYFDYLLTRFTEPSELFGPFDIRRLRDGELLTNTEGMLPEGEIIFLDELLNANSAILNSLLMALNERVFRRGRETRDLGFVLTVGASNNLPEDEALAALFDRFLLRVQSNNVPDEQLGSVLQAGWQLQKQDVQQQPQVRTVSVTDVRQLQRCIPFVDVSEVRDSYVALIRRLRHAGIEVSDRRAVRLQRLAAASALMCERSVVHLSDLWILKYIWETREQVEVLNRIVEEAIADDDSEERSTDASSLRKHPRATSAAAPDPEQLNRDLNQIQTDLSTTDPQHKSWLSDRLSLLAARIEWVPVDESRQFLRTRVTELRTQLANSTPEA
ncbi:MAG: AAA family ATPase [Planctomycetaceae bacterium]